MNSRKMSRLKKLMTKWMRRGNTHPQKQQDISGRTVVVDGGGKLYTYFNSAGEFDYDAYRRIQIEGNKNKLNSVWAVEANIEFLSNYIRRHIPNVNFGICHGTRQGKEQQWFRQYLNCDVIGTEISDTAAQFPHTIEWDFHEVKPEWVGSVDFIYSNAFDHSYDPCKCLSAWMSCLKPGGFCLIEHTSGHVKPTELDPFGADILVMPYLVLKWGKGRYFVKDLIDMPVKSSGIYDLKYCSCLVIHNCAKLTYG